MSKEKLFNLLTSQGDMATGADFNIAIEDCPNLSRNIVTCAPPQPGRHPVENVPGKGGIEVNQPGPEKSGGMMAVTFQSPISGKAFAEIADWSEKCDAPDGKKTVKIWATDNFEDDSPPKQDDYQFNITYKGCWPELDDADLDYENKTAPAKFTVNIHFGLRMWTKDTTSG